MGRRIHQGVTSSSSSVPQTIAIENNRISTVASNTSLQLRPTGSGVIDVTAVSASGRMAISATDTYTQDNFTTGALSVAGDISVAGKQQISGVLRVNGNSTFVTDATFSAGASFNTMTVSGLATFNELAEIIQSQSGATGVRTHDYSGGGIFFHSSIAANFTANFTNVPTTDNRGIAMVLILVQGATGRIPNAVQINGVPATLRWANNTVPTPSDNRVDVATFTLIRVSGSWTVLGNYTNYN